MRRLAFTANVVLGLLAGCRICELGESDLTVVSGTEPVPVNGELVLSLDSEGFQSGPGNCQGSWYVDGVAFGTGLLGTVNNCGVYTAPAVPPDHDVLIEAMKYPLGECSECCPYGYRRVRVVP